MKVLGLCAGRRNGNTEIMMKEAFRAIEEKCGAECKIVRVQETKINTCIGCETCMVSHLKGDWEFRCIHKNGSDHFYFIEQLMREADAIVVSSPAYNLLPTGQLIKLLNKVHASGDYRDVIRREPKIAAAFSIGGTDWTNFTPNFCKMIAMEICGTYDLMADFVHWDFINAKGNVFLTEGVLERMHQFGENIADALIKKANGEKFEYKGTPGICPDCHGTFLEKRADGWYCPQCLTKAELKVVDGEVVAEFTPEERAKSRWSPAGQELHENGIRWGHGRAAKGRETIKEGFGKYSVNEYVVELPELIKE